jgi:hypothetical protein
MIQILPIRISTFDQFQFPDSFPFLQPLLPLNSRLHALMQFVPNQMVDTIAFGKPFYHIIPVLPYPFDEIRSDADIESTVFLTRQNVYSGLLIHPFLLSPLDSGFRRNDEGRNDSLSNRGISPHWRRKMKGNFSSVLIVLFKTHPGLADQPLKIYAG